MDYTVIKNENLFFISDKQGNVPKQSLVKGLGLYIDDTRYLNMWELQVNEENPILLFFHENENFYSKQVEMIEKKDEGSFEIIRQRLIIDHKFVEQTNITNYFTSEKEIELNIMFDADFQDMFIIRGYRDGKLGQKLEPTISENEYSFNYLGGDFLPRKTRIQFGEAPDQIKKSGEVTYRFTLGAKETKSICVTVEADPTSGKSDEISFQDLLKKASKEQETWLSQNTKIETDYQPLMSLYQRSLLDLRMLLSNVGFGDIPVAGIPWYAVPFGRDSIITSLFMLSCNPRIAKNTLRTLAHYLGKDVNPWRDEQPGKVLHELRSGELAVTKQIPFGPYYGSVDSTPLFLVLAAEYFHWTGDREFIKELLPIIEMANEWIDVYGGFTKTGFVSYHQEAEMGNPNHGWKDSSNSNIHEDASLAKSPIALIEVQGYVYLAKKSIASIYREFGQKNKALHLEKEAEQLKELVEEKFWIEDENYYAIALDANLELVKSITSNPGHGLLANLFNPNRARAVASRLISNDLFSGYGIRTMSVNATGYNPTSYHNGTVWPHDNGMCLLGLSKLGFSNEVKKVVDGMVESSNHFKFQRLPELFCGYESSIGKPIPYPATCSPQAWAAGVGPLIIQVLLGIHPNHDTKTIELSPVLLKEMNEFIVNEISIGEGHLSVKIVKLETSQDIRVDIVENTTGYVVNTHLLGIKKGSC